MILGTLDTSILLSQLSLAEFSSSDGGSHLLDVQEKLQKFLLQESQVKLRLQFSHDDRPIFMDL